ncbi:MAG: hypothetical protein HY293_16840 [Planctomycetes bacterium]|nr:hypothetical protein [Planctomycetota bacterium]
MKALLLALLAALPSQEAPAREKASSFTFVRPKGWARQEMQNNVTGLLPPGADAQQCSCFIFPGQAGEINELVFHDRMFQSITPLCQIDKTSKACRGSWQFTWAKILTPQKQNQWLILYTTKSGPHLETLYFVAASEELLNKHRFAIDRMVTGIEFPDARPAPSGAPEWKPAPIPDKEKDVKIVGAWIVARLESEFSVDPKAGGAAQKQTVKVVALFENGVAAKLDAVRTGLNDSTYPAEGLAALAVSNPGPNDRRFGKWSETEGKISLKWNQGPEDQVQREGNDVKDAQGTLWSALKPIDGVRLARTFIRENPAGLPGLLVLRKDGTFDADQVNETMGGKLVNPKFPELGTGTYEFRKWSLILRFDTGFVQSIHVMFDAEDPATAKRIIVSGTDFALPGTVVPSGILIHGLRIPLPADWIRKDDPTGAVFLFPPQNQNPNGYLLMISPTQKLQGTHWETHKAMLKSALAWAQIPEAGATIQNIPGGPGFFVHSVAAGKTTTGEYRGIQLYTAPHDGLMEAITTVNVAKPDTYVFWPILQRTTFKDPPKEDRPRIIEAYRKLVRKMYTNPGGAELAMGNLMYERMWLRSDGTADFTSWYKEGYAVSPDAPKVDGGLLTGQAGKWKAVGDRIEVRRSATDAPLVYERVNGGLGEWESMPRVDGLRLSGRWSKKSLPAAGVTPYYHWLEFKEDGSFTIDGAITFVAELDQDWPKLPNRFSGTYEILDWTLFLALEDGRTWSTDFSLIHKDPKDLSGILIRTMVFLKE